MSARFPDGTVIATLADGTVHPFSAEDFAAQLRKAGPPAD
jgi:hypothetical protein